MIENSQQHLEPGILPRYVFPSTFIYSEHLGNNNYSYTYRTWVRKKFKNKYYLFLVERTDNSVMKVINSANIEILNLMKMKHKYTGLCIRWRNENNCKLDDIQKEKVL